MDDKPLGTSTEFPRPTYIDIGPRGVLRTVYIQCPDCGEVQRSLKASPDPRAGECVCPVIDIGEPERVIMLAGDPICDDVDPEKCTACRHVQALFDLGGES